MMKLLFLALIASCTFWGGTDTNDDSSTGTVNEETRNQIATDMATLNSRLRAILLRQEKWADLSILSTEKYLKKAQQYHLPAEGEYIEFLKAKDIELVLVGQKMNFSICTRSNNLNLIFCDRSDTAMIEFSDSEIDYDLREKVQEYL